MLLALLFAMPFLGFLNLSLAECSRISWNLYCVLFATVFRCLQQIYLFIYMVLQTQNFLFADNLQRRGASISALCNIMWFACDILEQKSAFCMCYMFKNEICSCCYFLFRNCCSILAIWISIWIYSVSNVFSYEIIPPAQTCGQRFIRGWTLYDFICFWFL